MSYCHESADFSNNVVVVDSNNNQCFSPFWSADLYMRQSHRLIAVPNCGTSFKFTTYTFSFNASSTRGKCINDTGSPHFNLHFLHNSLAKVSLLLGYLLSFIILLSLLMETVKAYQKQLLSSLTILMTDDLLRMLSLFLSSDLPDP